jgi:2-oxoglutarate dehydrogenase E2 component (dihydrolipoamide succinyltransferase)
MPTITVTMPQMGESVTEGTIERWLVQVGERVEKDQILCEVTTDKVDAEIPAPVSGVISKLLVSEGETVEVGTDLAVLDPEGKAKQEPAPSAPAARKAESREPAPIAEPAAVEGASRPEPQATPVARRMAESEGVALAWVQPSGAGGRVTKADVERELSTRKAPGPAPERAPARERARAEPGSLADFLAAHRVPVYRPGERDTVVPFSAIRRRIAEHMVVSKIVSPHVGTVAEIDLYRLSKLRDEHKDAFRKQHGSSLTYLPFLVQATVRGLKQFPRMNAAVVEQQIIERADIHIGVAVETERGLVVPVVRDAADLSLSGLAKAIDTLARKARDRELSADDLWGGTFTITNPGRQGNLYGFAVINQPQVGILRMGEVKKRAVVVEQDGEDQIAIRPIMHLALSYDHRIIDGATGNGFLFFVARELEAGSFEL